MGSPYRIIADKDTALGFRFAGVPGDVAENHDEALAAFEAALKERDLVVLLLTGPVAEMLDAEVTAHKLKATRPFIATIEDIWGRRGRTRTLEQLIFDAVGIKIVESEN